ncbi:MAG: ParB N-terminal domain-containing protein [Alphaproteobacteria bacterium]|nr:ParB N-terminal domain-containing protein [Alphaproteobacteria bacterium]
MNKYGEIPTFAWVDINKLHTENKYQRDTLSRASQRNISKIVQEFCWSKFTPLTVCDNKDGTFNIIDGGHRTEAARMLGDIRQLPCWVIDNASIEKQSADFVDINKNRVVVNPFQIFYAQALAGDIKAQTALDFCKNNNIAISRNGAVSTQPNITLALSFLKRNASSHPKELAFVISIIRQALPGMCGQLKADIMTCLLKFRLKNGPACEKENVRKILISTLREFGDVNIISRQAAAAHATDKQRTQYHFNRIFIEAYKRSMKTIKE